MGILDEAIKEHLELKRQHGADASELKQLEDEAFGAAERPGEEEAPADPLVDAPTEFMQSPDMPEAAAEAEASEAAPLAEAEEPAGRPEPRAEIGDLQEAPERSEPEQSEQPEEPEEPAEEESPAMEHEAIREPEPEPPSPQPEPTSSGPSTEEREQISEQPTEMYDLEEELGPDVGAEAEEAERDADDFFDEKRLSDELDQALEAPAEPQAEEEGEGDYEAEEEEPRQSESPANSEEEDVLEETPDFLEEAPEDDRLWFEQKPPKDFDFDD